MSTPTRFNLPMLKCLTVLVCLAFCALLNQIAQAQALTSGRLTPAEARGKKIYTQGTSQSGKEILAYIGEASLEVPASTMPCANCHGLDGKGKPEGGIVPSNLTWEELTKPYGATHADGRQHPPYTERALELAIQRGTDPAGNRLLSVMPRYVMSKEDLTDLILYLKRVGSDRDPGISDSKIIIGTTIPTGAQAETGEAIKAVLTAFFDDLNNQGGIYSRRFEMKFIEMPEAAKARRAAVERFLTDDQIFALAGAFIAGSEKEIIPLLAEKEVPLIGPVTFYPQTGTPLNRQVFYVLSGVDSQARALVDFVAKKPEVKNSGIAIAYSQGDLNEGVVNAIKDQSKNAGLSTPSVFNYRTGGLATVETVRQLKQGGRETLFFLGSSDELMSIMKEADRLKWYPSILQPGSSGGAGVFNAPIGFSGKLFFSVPTSPADQTEKGTREFFTLAERYKLPRHHLAVQVSVYSAAKILVEALRRIGKDISREKLIQTLEGLYQYPTELTPVISYGPNRRIGAMGAYVVQIDLQEKKLLPASGWIDITDSPQRQ